MHQESDPEPDPEPDPDPEPEPESEPHPDPEPEPLTQLCVSAICFSVLQTCHYLIRLQTSEQEGSYAQTQSSPQPQEPQPDQLYCGWI